MWFCIHVFDACALIFFTFTIWNDFTTNPLVTTLHDTIYPIENIPFPAVTVCTNNRISRREAIKLAIELWEPLNSEIILNLNIFLSRALNDTENDPSGTKDADDYLKEIEFIGRIYDYEVENEHHMTSFQQFLDKTINETNVYNFSSIVYRVSNILMTSIK